MRGNKFPVFLILEFLEFLYGNSDFSQNLLEQTGTNVLAVRIGNFDAKISPLHKLMSTTGKGTDKTDPR